MNSRTSWIVFLLSKHKNAGTIENHTRGTIGAYCRSPRYEFRVPLHNACCEFVGMVAWRRNVAYGAVSPVRSHRSLYQSACPRIGLLSLLWCAFRELLSDGCTLWPSVADYQGSHNRRGKNTHMDICNTDFARDLGDSKAL